jgi:hypothetical protein
MKTKINKESRNLLIAMLLGDGTICSNYVFKLSHGDKQKEYLEWKIKQLNEHGIRNNGLKSYTSTCGFNLGKTVYYTQLSVIPFIKTLRRVCYKPYKILGNRKLLNRLDAKGIAIWFMDDGNLNPKKREGVIKGFYIKISTCLPKDQVQVIIDYFKEEWNISFYMFHEGKKEDSYSLCCGTKEGRKFLDIVSPTIREIPSMLYKIQFNKSQDIYNILSNHENDEMQSSGNTEDIVHSSMKVDEISD